MPNQQTLRIQQTIQKALSLHQQGRLEEAAWVYEGVLQARPNHFDALHFLGVVRLQQGNLEAAVELITRALRREPRSADAHSNLGNVLAELGRHEEAVASYERALALKPDHADALYNRGTALEALNRYEEAVASYDGALALNPDHADALINRGNALHALNRHEAAIATYDEALAVEGDHATALYNRGAALLKLKRYGEAASSFEQALELRPDYPFALGPAAYSRTQICDWKSRALTETRLMDDVRAGKLACEPFSFLAFSHSAADQRTCAISYVHDKHPAIQPPLWQGEHYRHDRIRLAYLSADFHEHAVADLMAELFEIHDRRRFDVVGISFGPNKPSPMRTRLSQGMERFIDVRQRKDVEIARLVRELEIDIAVDLMGFTANSRTGIFAHRAAPVQVNYLGYPGTMGAEYIDYILADRVIIPEEHHPYYTEKVVYLPDCYQANDSKRRIAESTPSRAEVGLPEDGFVFCCFNNHYKITPALFNVWMKLLRQVEGSALWLVEPNPTTADNLRREAKIRSVEPSRLIFAPRVNVAEHLARHHLADLFLDTLPYNAHTTASDALWAGLPVLTCQGKSFAGRVVASLLTALELTELVTPTLADYESLALKLATDGERLAQIKAKLVRDRVKAPLFHTDRFRRHIEAAYQTMWEIYQRGEAPKSFAVEPVSV